MILTYPGAVKRKKQRSKDPMPSHLNSSQMIRYMEEQKRKKDEQEQEKERRKAERAAKKREKEEARAQKQAEKEARECRRQASKSQSRCKHRTRVQRHSSTDECFAESESSNQDVEDASDPQDPVDTDGSNIYICPVCGGIEDEDSEGEEWIACDSCHMWYHQNCVSIPLSEHCRH